MEDNSDFESLSKQSKDFLTHRFRHDKKFNGLCLGPFLCVDNLGRNYHEDSLRVQLDVLLADVVKIQFATVEIGSHKWQRGWCCIEFVSVEAAVSAMAMLDHIYIDMKADSGVLRPLLAHFPNWNDIKYLKISKETVSPMALHYGQLNITDRESRAFIRLDAILETTRATFMNSIRNQLVTCLRKDVTFDPHSTCMADEMDIDDQFGLFFLKDVPQKVTDDELEEFFGCVESDIHVFRITDPVTLKPIPQIAIQVSSAEKAKLICEDIETYMLLSDGFRPILASLADSNHSRGFESLFDQALDEAGRRPISSAPLMDLIYFKESTSETERMAYELRSILDTMQNYRSCCVTLKDEKYQNLHDKIVAKVCTLQNRFHKHSRALRELERYI